MKIAHTSDWHAGRIFKQIPRLPELESVLENLGDDLEREKIDILLVSGDVFDSGAPVAEAERAVFNFFKRVGRFGVRTVVIAGNHDSPARLEAWGSLAELVDVRVVAKPRPADAGGLVTIRTRSGETALVAAVPFAAPRHLVSALQMAADDTLARQRYADGMRAIVANVTEPFRSRSDAVNLLMLHTHMAGAAFSGSERKVHLGDEWAATPQVLPTTAQYVALGHIHKPQRIEAPAPAEYAGSPLQMDFGEAGEEKSWVLVDASAGMPVHREHVPYRGGKPLLEIRATLSELERDAPTLSAKGYLWVTVPLTQPEPDLSAKVRRLLPNAVKIEADLPRTAAAETHRPTPSGATPRLRFAGYYRSEHGTEPSEALLDAFDLLLEKAES